MNFIAFSKKNPDDGSSMMCIRDEEYAFKRVVELDDAYFIEEEKGPQKRRRGRQIKVVVPGEPKMGRPRKQKKSSSICYVKPVVVANSSAAWVNGAVQTSVSRHIKQTIGPQEASNLLLWVHTIYDQ